jgi:hypothetical protein
MLQHSLTKTKVLEPCGSSFSDQYQIVGITRRSQGNVEKDEKRICFDLYNAVHQHSLQF